MSYTEKTEPGVLEERAVAGLHEHIAFKLSTLDIAKDAAIMDCGCGSGSFLSRLMRNGYTNLYGVDIAVPSASIFNSIRLSEIDFDKEPIPYREKTFDVITCIETIEHIENPGRLLSELSRILKPNGLLLISTPNMHSLVARFRFFASNKLKQFDEIGDPTHIYPVFLYPFCKMASRSLLELKECWGYPLDGSSPTSRHVLRLAAWGLRIFGLSGQPDGDCLCLLFRRLALVNDTGDDKRSLLTAHY